MRLITDAYDGDANAIYLFKDKKFDDQVDLEKGSCCLFNGLRSRYGTPRGTRRTKLLG